jgi:hypothetical protein
MDADELARLLGRMFAISQEIAGSTYENSGGRRAEHDLIMNVALDGKPAAVKMLLEASRRWAAQRMRQGQSDTGRIAEPLREVEVLAARISAAGLPKVLPMAARCRMVTHEAAVRLERRRPGRPEVGNRVTVRLGELKNDVDAYAAERGLTRAEAVRVLTSAGLRQTCTGAPTSPKTPPAPSGTPVSSAPPAASTGQCSTHPSSCV